MHFRTLSLNAIQIINLSGDIMDILYFGKVCDDDLFKKKEQEQTPFFIAQYMFEKALAEEFLKNDELDIEIVSIYQMDYFPKNEMFFNRKKCSNSKICYLKFVNIPYLRELTYFISACVYIISWYIRHSGERNKCIYSSCHFPPVSLAVVSMGRVFSIKKIVTFTDLSLFTYSKEKVKIMKIYKKLLMKPYVFLVNKLQKSYDAYILFSQEMNNIVNLTNKPYVVIEGIYNSEHLNMNDINIKANAIAHAGTLNKEVGIDKILDVFNLIDDKSIELWLIGKGDMTEEIIERAKLDNRIKYLGFIPRNNVFEKLKEAKLLLNLRNPDDVYTKYSFPSKTFEYMVSGTPYLTTRIAGIPEEYYQYLYVVEDYSVLVVKQKIEEVLDKPQSELDDFGQKARKFVLENKNSEIQAKKIIDMIQRMN
jgi:glycosyltransferase involved in cell wall biosynthesis